MKINVMDRSYNLDPNSIKSARASIMYFLDKVKKKAEDESSPGYYTVIVIMMYVLSSSILKKMDTEDVGFLIKKNEETKNAPRC